MKTTFKWPELWGHTAIENNIRSGHLPKAVMVGGPPGSGKTLSIALFLSFHWHQKLKLHSRWEQACQNAQPDVFFYDGKSMDRESLRQARRRWQCAPVEDHKFIIITHCDELNPSSTNALLKSVEEPGPHTTFFFTYQRAHNIPLTLRSRCQHWFLSPLNLTEFSRALKHESLNATELESLYHLSWGCLGQAETWISLCPFWTSLEKAWDDMIHGPALTLPADMLDFFQEEVLLFRYFLEQWWVRYTRMQMSRPNSLTEKLWHKRDYSLRFWDEAQTFHLEPRYLITHLCQWIKYQ